MLRIFKKYSPLLVAKHVRTMYKGRLYIAGLGAYEFDHGAMLKPKNSDERHLQTIVEINQEIKRNKF